MPFGLNNTGATYQRLINKMFAHQIGRSVQVFIDDMLVKSIREDDHLDDLKETFDTLRSYNMKLNQRKCAFEVTAESSRLGSMGQRVYGRKNYQMFYGHTGRRQGCLQEKHCFD